MAYLVGGLRSVSRWLKFLTLYHKYQQVIQVNVMNRFLCRSQIPSTRVMKSGVKFLSAFRPTVFLLTSKQICQEKTSGHFSPFWGKY